MAMQCLHCREAQGGGHENSLQGCTVHGFFMDCPWLGHGLSVAFHGLFRDCSWLVQGLFRDCSRLVYGLSMPCSWLVHRFYGLFTDRSWLVHSGLSMACSQWTVHGLFMDCSWLVYRLFMACSWRTVHGLFMDCSWTDYGCLPWRQYMKTIQRSKDVFVTRSLLHTSVCHGHIKTETALWQPLSRGLYYTRQSAMDT